MAAIPEKIVNYNIYSEGDRLVGISGEVTLPNLEPLMETISGAGIAGEIESPTPGHFASIEMEIPFRTVTDQSFKIADPNGHTLTLRAAQQGYDVSGGKIDYRGLKITVKGLPKGIDLGTASPGKPSETTNKIEVVYIKIEEGGKELLELDKLNFICKINGADILEPIRSKI